MLWFIFWVPNAPCGSKGVEQDCFVLFSVLTPCHFPIWSNIVHTASKLSLVLLKSLTYCGSLSNQIVQDCQTSTVGMRKWVASAWRLCLTVTRSVCTVLRLNMSNVTEFQKLNYFNCFLIRAIFEIAKKKRDVGKKICCLQILGQLIFQSY